MDKCILLLSFMWSEILWNSVHFKWETNLNLVKDAISYMMFSFEFPVHMKSAYMEKKWCTHSHDSSQQIIQNPKNKDENQIHIEKFASEIDNIWKFITNTDQKLCAIVHKLQKEVRCLKTMVLQNNQEIQKINKTLSGTKFQT